MDAQHHSDLNRILENRKRRGVRQPTPEASPYPQRQADVYSSPVAVAPKQPTDTQVGGGASSSSPTNRFQRQNSSQPVPVSVMTPQQSFVKSSVNPNGNQQHRVSEGYQSQSQLPPRAPSPIVRSSPVRAVDRQPMQKFSATAPTDAADKQREHESRIAAQLLQQQATLQKNQLDQQRQLQQMQSELRTGLSNVSSALRTGGSPGYGLTNERKQSFYVKSDSFNSRLDGLQRGGSFDRYSNVSGSGGPRERAIKFSSLEERSRMESVPSQMPKNVPLPIRFDPQEGKMVAQPRAVQFPGDESRALERYEEAVAAAPKEPAPIPAIAQPFSTSTIDIDSSVTVLKAGAWFLKWNAKGNEVKPRFVWLDPEKNIISWGKETRATSLLSGYIRIEEIVNVSTDQMTELGPDDVPRVFYVLLITERKGRRIQLATERREKLNQWYDALGNISLFYRVRGTQLMHSLDPSTE